MLKTIAKWLLSKIALDELALVIIDILQEKAAKTPKKWDDKVLEIIERLITEGTIESVIDLVKKK